jgi:hypothetical protein
MSRTYRGRGRAAHGRRPSFEAARKNAVSVNATCPCATSRATAEADDFVPVLASADCRALDLKIDRDTGRLDVLVERKNGNDPSD